MKATIANSMSDVSAVYRQCWPHPTSMRSTRPIQLKLPHEWHHISCNGGHPRLCKSSPHVQTSHNYKLLSKAVALNSKNPNDGTNAGRSSSHVGPKMWYQNGSTSLQACLGLDQGTLHWKSWRKFREDVENSDNKEIEMFKITQDTFRQLTNQVHEVNMQMKRKNTGCGLKSYHSSSPYTTRSVVIYPSQLASSLPKQPPSIQEPRVYRESSGSHRPVPVVCSRPTTQQDQRSQRPQSHLDNTPRRCVVLPSRPSSCPSRTKDLPLYQGHATSKEMAPSKEVTAENLGPFEIVARGYQQTVREGLESEDVGKNVSILEEHSIASKSDLESMKWVNSRQEKTYLHKKFQDVKLLPEDKPTDYPSSNVPSPEPDPIFEALSEPFCYMDLLELSEEEDWRKAVRRVPADKDEEMIMDRLIEMERLQEETVKLEYPSKKQKHSVIEEKKGWDTNAAKPTEEAQKKLDEMGKSRNCSVECLQPACAGDCPKVSSHGCLHCHQRHCRGQCVEYGYHLHVRTPRGICHGKIRPKSCHSCVRRGKKLLNTVNANNVIHGRPRSAFSTFSSVQHENNLRQTKIFFSEESHNGEILRRLKSLKLVSPRDSTVSNKTSKRRVKSAKHSTGRDSSLPGKRYDSQRRKSITTEVCSTSAAQLNSPLLRAQSVKQRRIRSAKH